MNNNITIGKDLGNQNHYAEFKGQTIIKSPGKVKLPIEKLVWGG